MKHASSTRVPLSLFALWLLPSLSQAQTAPAPSTSAAASTDDDETVQLSPFEVRAITDSGYRVANSVSTTGVAQSLLKTPLPITVITQEFLRDADLDGFAGALRYVSSLSFDPHTADGNNPPGGHSGGTPLGNGNPNLNRFRGQPYNGTYRNGLRVLYGFGTDNVDRIEVAKGPMSVFVGGATLGGEMNTITKKPVFHRYNEVTARIASHNTFKETLDTTGPLSKTVAYRLIGSYEDRNTWRDFSNARIEYINPQLLWRPSARFDLRLEYYYRYAAGNLVSQNTASTTNLSEPFINPPQYLLDLGKRRTGALAGVPFTPDEYRARIARGFGQWRADVYDATGQWVSLGQGEALTDGNAPNGRKYNYYGPNDPFQTKVNLWELESKWSITDWLDAKLIGRYTNSYSMQYYYWYSSRIWADGSTPLIYGDSMRLHNDNYDGKLELAARKTWFDVHNTLLLGVQGAHETRTIEQGAWDLSKLPSVPGSPNVWRSPATLTGANIFNYFDPAFHSFPDIRLAHRWRGETTADGVVSQTERRLRAGAAYAAGTAEWKRWALTGGFRRDRSGYTSENQDHNGNVTYFPLGSANIERNVVPYTYTESWMYGLVMRITDGLYVYGSHNYGETTQAGSRVGKPAFAGNTAVLTPQEIAENPNPNTTGEGNEFGIKFELFKAKLTGSVSYFNLTRGGIMVSDIGRTSLDERNIGTEVDPNPATADYNRRVNIMWTMPVDGNETAGFETDLIWTPVRNYSVIVGASHLTKNKLTVDNPQSRNPTLNMTYEILNGRPLENAPDETLKVYQRYAFTEGTLKGFSAGAGVRYQSSVMPSANEANWGLVFPSFYVVDANLGYAMKLWGKDVNFGFSVTNLLNRSYVEGGRVYGPPREYAFTTRVAF